MASLSIKSSKTKYSKNISEVLDRTAQMLQGNPEAEAQAMAAGGQPSSQPMSRGLKLPTNTNEEV